MMSPSNNFQAMVLSSGYEYSNTYEALRPMAAARNATLQPRPWASVASTWASLMSWAQSG